MNIVNFTVNGVVRQAEASPDMVLLDYLRGTLQLTGAKQSCDKKGQCGACTVIVDEKAVKSCLRKVVDLEGSSVLTVEGLGTPDNPHLIQEAFVLSGAIQCGFCTPGMIMAVKALLDNNPNPTLPEIKRALARNLCRCTGYIKIIDAIKLAGKLMRHETTPDQIRAGYTKKGIIGVPHPRPSAMLKACGAAEFTADVKVKGAAEIAVVHSTEHHAIIKSIDSSYALKMPGVIGIMTAADIKGTNRIRVVIPDQPVLCEDRVRLLGDPIAIIAAETRDQARAAAAAVKVEYERLPAMMTPQEALAPGAKQIHNQWPNLYISQPLLRGDTEKAFTESAAVVEADFTTQINHQAPMEPEASVAYLDGDGEDAQLVITGRSINIHGHKSQLAESLGCKNVRYKEAFAGGQFGIKLAITTEALAGAAALHFKRPICYVPSLTESMLLTSKRHPFYMKVKLGADKNGRLTAYTNDMTIGKGAYLLYGVGPMNRAIHMLTAGYYIPNLQAMARVVFTNNAYGGAARGAGPPQTSFALESAINLLAEKLGIDPLEIRRINALQAGQPKATGQVVKQWEFAAICDMIKPHYERAKKDAAAFNASAGVTKRGVGVAGHSFGIGMSGDRAKLSIELDSDDGLTIYAAVADPGEGSDSMLSQLAAHVLEIPLNRIRLFTRDTNGTVAMGAAAGSRMTFMAGGALVNALEQLKKAMAESGSKTCDGLKQAGKPTRYDGYFQLEGDGKLDPTTGQGSSFQSDVHNVQLVELEVNIETGEVRVIKITAAVDAGPIINPQAFEGQLEGGMDQGVGYALREEYIPGKTKDWVSFKFPTIEKSFEMEILTKETPRIVGTLGSTGIGEMTMVSTAPAVIGAIRNACGAMIYNLPATPDKIKAALAGNR